VNPNKVLWEKGDFTRIAQSMRESGEALVKTLGITKGLKVLDLGCGDGTTALPAARLGAEVLGVDIASNLVAAGKQRANEQGLTNCRFQEGRRQDRYGKLDSQRSDTGRANLENQLSVLAAAAGRVCKPDDLGN
jgi:tRNA/tmRNA/rRNA uracil-C5-methylase (TrmA/RlmC/RlmD family)